MAYGSALSRQRLWRPNGLTSNRWLTIGFHHICGWIRRQSDFKFITVIKKRRSSSCCTRKRKMMLSEERGRGGDGGGGSENVHKDMKKRFESRREDDS